MLASLMMGRGRRGGRGEGNAASATATHGAIEAVWRIESAKIIAVVARMLRDVGTAEELAQDVLITALEQWPEKGVPDNPAAWLTAAAKNRALDHLRRNQLLERKHQELGVEMEIRQELADAANAEKLERIDEDIDDDLLRLIFTACHPVLSSEARVALTLRLLGGLTTDEIARAFLMGEPTVAQRIVRAKRTLTEAKVPFELPRGEDRAARLASVLEVLYLIFNEGYAATAGEDWMRPALCDEALRLGRILAGLLPDEAEVHGLTALMEIQASRAAARTGLKGEPILLLEQNRARWDHLLINRGLAALARAEALGAFGPYALQAAIAACHARAAVAAATDWPRIAALYDALGQLTPSPVIELNRAVAVSMAYGPATGLEIVDALLEEPALKNYHLLPSVRGDFLFRLGRMVEAGAEFARAATLTRNARERSLLLARAQDCARALPPA